MFLWHNVNFLGNDDDVKIGLEFINSGWTDDTTGTPLPPVWGLNPCTVITGDPSDMIPLPDNFVYSEGESIWTIWKEDGKLNILYNGEDFLRDGYPGVTEGLDCVNPSDYPNGKDDWEQDWEAELISVRFDAYTANAGGKLDGYRFIPIPVDAEPGKY